MMGDVNNDAAAPSTPSPASSPITFARSFGTARTCRRGRCGAGPRSMK